MRTILPAFVFLALLGCQPVGPLATADGGGGDAGACVSPVYPSTNGERPICDPFLEFYGCETFEGMSFAQFAAFCLDERGDSPTTDVQPGGDLSRESVCWTCD